LTCKAASLKTGVLAMTSAVAHANRSSRAGWRREWRRADGEAELEANCAAPQPSECPPDSSLVIADQHPQRDNKLGQADNCLKPDVPGRALTWHNPRQPHPGDVGCHPHLATYGEQIGCELRLVHSFLNRRGCSTPALLLR